MKISTNDFFEKVHKLEFDEYNSDSENDNDNCEHDYIIDGGFNVCKLCGIIDIGKQIFITQTENNKYNDNSKAPTKTIYSQVNEIRKHLIEYTITQQNQIPDDTYQEVYNKLVKLIPKKFIKLALLNSDVSFNNFYSRFAHTEPVYLTTSQLNHICSIAQKFIKRKYFKNINKKALVYMICLDEYNIVMDDYTTNMTESVLQKYKTAYLQFKQSLTKA